MRPTLPEITFDFRQLRNKTASINFIELTPLILINEEKNTQLSTNRVAQYFTIDLNDETRYDGTRQYFPSKKKPFDLPD